jgi:hypothetical protein
MPTLYSCDVLTAKTNRCSIMISFALRGCTSHGRKVASTSDGMNLASSAACKFMPQSIHMQS